MHYAKWTKPDPTGYMLCKFVYILEKANANSSLLSMVKTGGQGCLKGEQHAGTFWGGRNGLYIDRGEGSMHLSKLIELDSKKWVIA